jgi:uridine kinase
MESLELKPEYLALGQQITDWMLRQAEQNASSRWVVAIGGESGSGKSTSALAVQRALSQRGIANAVLHLDGYFHLTPRENAAKRRENLNWVGPQELNLERAQQDIDAFHQGVRLLTVPRVHYERNSFYEESLTLEPTAVLLVEGVYAFALQRMNEHIALERTYLETRAQRIARTREVYDPFVEQVLALEHEHVTELNKRASAWIRTNYSFDPFVPSRV